MNLVRKILAVALIIAVASIVGGFTLLKPKPSLGLVDKPPRIISIQIEKTHHDPARIRRDFTFFFDFSMEATDDHNFAQAFVIIYEPDGSQSTIDLVEVSGRYSDAFQAWNSGTYVFQFCVIDNQNQQTVSEINRTVFYDTFAQYMQKYVAEGWNPEFLLEVYRLDKRKIESLYGTPNLELYLDEMLNLMNG